MHNDAQKTTSHKKSKESNTINAPSPRQQLDDPIPQVEAAQTDIEIKGLTLRILTWNVDGFRDPARRITIESALWKNKADIAVLTESHLLDEDIFTSTAEGKERIMKIHLTHYKVAHWHNRESTVTQRCGGVLILTRPGIDVTLLPQDILPQRPLSCCSLIVEAVGGCSQPFRLTGVYLPPPPTARVTKDQMSSLITDHPSCRWKGRLLNHILCGDFNPPSWQEQFDDWVGMSGLIELSDPSIATFPSGNALDRIFLLPGEEIWEAVLPPSLDAMKEMEGDFELEDDYYPAAVLPVVKPSAHQQVYLDLPFVEEKKQPGLKTINISKLDSEEWTRRNNILRNVLASDKEVYERDFTSGNVDRMYQRIMRSIKVVIADCITKGGSADFQRDPVDAFCKRNARHPRIKHLRMAAESEDYVTFTASTSR